jgi:adenine/guanine/hypoxanthine permease
MGILIGASARAGFLDENGNLPQIERPMAADALSSRLVLWGEAGSFRSS